MHGLYAGPITAEDCLEEIKSKMGQGEMGEVASPNGERYEGHFNLTSEQFAPVSSPAVPLIHCADTIGKSHNQAQYATNKVPKNMHSMKQLRA